MRSALRVSLAGVVIFCLVSLSLLWTHRDDWKQHLHDVSRYGSYFASKEESDLYLNKGSSGMVEDVASASGGADLQPGPGVSTSSGGAGGPPVQLHTPTPQPAADEKAVVMAKTAQEDTSWVAELSSWQPYVYSVDNASAPLHTPKNKGHEAMAYLTYIIDNYDNLASTVAFVHAHKDGYPQAWHTDNERFSNVLSLTTLRTDYIQHAGYANLRCNAVIGCDPPEIQPSRWLKEPHRTAEAAVPDAWAALFGPDAALPSAIGEACCAQFAVSRARIRGRARAKYVRYRDWLLRTELADDVSGRIIEYFWHVIFGKEPVFCPDTYDCYCNLYGHCA